MKRIILWLLLPLFFSCFLILVLVGSCEENTDLTKPSKPGPLREITIAYDPNKARLFEELVSSYNSRATIKVQGIKLEIQEIQEALSEGDLVAVSPDSAFWLESFDNAWKAARSDASSIIGTIVRYATTPVVIATWQGREGELGTPGERGWATLLKRASGDPTYRWSHGSPRASASGTLALVAEFYAGAGKSHGLTKEDADREEVRRYVDQLEKTIARYGGESDAALVDYLLKDGSKNLSATVLPEASVFDFNRRSRVDKLYAIHPTEGTLMLDHPLVLLETPDLTPEQRRAFLDFSRYLTGPEGQAIVVKHGFRPVDLAFDMAKSPLVSEGIPAQQPKLLQMPVPGTLNYLRGAWASGLKRRANILLVVDVSGSMEGEKLSRTKEALNSFLKQVPSDEERVGMITFSSDIVDYVPLDRLGSNRKQLLSKVEGLKANGNTAFYYSLWLAHWLLADLADTERINVVVAMTDGRENASGNFSRKNVQGIGVIPQITGSNARDTAPLLRALQRNGPGIMVFTVGYGGDADMEVLSSIASAFDGQGYRADPDTIRKLYELISQNF